MNSGLTPHGDTTSLQLCTFWTGGRLYGLDILDVQEIHASLRFTEIPHAPALVQGVVNIRGRIVLILAMRRILGFAPAELQEHNRLVLFKPAVGPDFGVLVDSIGDVAAAQDSLIEPMPQDSPVAGAQGHSLFSGVCRFPERLAPIVDARKLWLLAADFGGA